MKKLLIMFGVICGLYVPIITLAELEQVDSNKWYSASDEYWLNQTCDEKVENEMYVWSRWLYIDTFTNKGNSDLYILKTKLLTAWKYIKQNESKQCFDDGSCDVWLAILNTNLKWSDNRIKVPKKTTVLHMTTAEKLANANFLYDESTWKLSTPYHSSLGDVFNYANYSSDWTHPSKPTYFPSWDAEFRIVTLYSSDYKISTPEDNKAIVECQRTVIRRCGDGILDTTLEECDPAAPGWDETTCNPVNCKKLPVCSSFYSGQELTDIVDPSKLCTEGTVKNFKYDEATRTWTWECEAAWTGVECSAKKRYNGTWEVEKTLVSETKYITKVWQELVWEIKVTAKNGDLKDMKITDKLPPVLDYVSYSVVKLPSWITIADDQPTFSSDRKNVYWQTKWDFKNWETIILRVVTKANAMPKVTDNYKNVACASPEGEEDKCDDEPVKTEWALKIEKTLTWKVTVQQTGEVLTWDIKVTALWWDVDGFEIKDFVPSALQYMEYKATSNPDNLTVKGPTWPVKTSTWNVYTWSVSWVLQSGHSLLLTVKTEVIQMPKAKDDHRNVACVVKDDNKDCDDDKPWNPDLRIKKSFTDWTKEKTVKIWDEIAYKITFGNSGNAVATITSIKDFLPKNVWYVSSSIFVNGEKIHTNVESGSEIINENKRVDGVFVDIYGGITLKPGEYGHIILTWKVLTWNQDNRTNFACIYLNDEKIDCDDATHNFVEETVMCESDIKWGSNNICNGSNRTVPVTCNSTWWVANKIEIICDNTVQYSWTNISTLTWNCVFGPSAWSHTVQCKVNWSTKAVTGSSCEWNYTVTNSCGWWSSCFIAWTRVLMCNGDEKPIEQVQTWDCVQWETRQNTVKWYDRPKLGDRNLWRINKKWDYFVSDEHPFKTTQWWKSFNPEMSAEEIDKAWEEWMIKGEYPTIVGKLDIKDVLYRRKWQEIIEYLEPLDPAEKKPDTQLYNLVLDGDNTYYANGYLVHNKWSSWGWSKTPSCEAIDIKDDKIKCTSTTTTAYFKLTCDKKEYIYTEEKDRDHEFKNTDVCKNAKTITCSVSKNTNWSWSSSSKCEEERKEYPTPQWCFNVNEGNFSIEEKEILPFYRNMANLDSEYYGNGDNYTKINGDYKNAESNYNNKWSCTEEQEGKIAKDSMVCTFIIADGDKNHYGKKPDWTNSENYLYKITWPCLSADNAVKKSDLIKARYDQMVKDYCKDNRTCYFYYNEERPNVSNYKKAVLPTAVYYIESFGSNAQIYANVWWDSRELQWNKWKETQKAFWEYKMQLSEVKYLRCNWGSWQQEIPKEAVCQSNFVLTNSYTVQKTPSWNLQASTDKLSKYLQYNGDPVFVKLLNAIQTTTYEPNANVEKAMKSFIDKYSKLAVKVKVDLKNNSFLKGSSISKVPWKSIYFVDGDITINWWWNKIKNPFTIVQTKWNAIVNGDINYNMMLLTNWNITFKWNCESDQKVKWIFYAWGNLSRGDSIDKNDSTAHKYWCTKGGLHVKWVLIWKNFNQLMNKSRSHINDWFTWQESNRKSYVMNGASVLIDTSPSLFTNSTMPPGADDSTTAYSIHNN